MKKLIFLLLAIVAVSSCSLNDDSPEFRLELLPIESVELPQEFVLGQTYTIIVKYFRPTDCHFYDGIYYEKDLNVRTFAVRNAVSTNNTCLSLDNVLIEQTFDFYVTSNGSYIFKFWQGVNEEGENIFLEYEIPVTD